MKLFKALLLLAIATQVGVSLHGYFEDEDTKPTKKRYLYQPGTVTTGHYEED